MPAGITAVPAGIPNVPAGLYDCELKFMLEIEIHTTKSYVCRNEEEEGVEDESKVRGGRHAWVYDRVETGLSGIKLFHSTTKRIAFFDKISSRKNIFQEWERNWKIPGASEAAL